MPTDRAPSSPLARLALPLALVGLVLGAPAWAATARDDVESVHPLADGGLVDVSNVNGSTEIVTWDREEVRVEARREVEARSRADAEAALEELRVEVEERGGDLRIDTDLPDDGGWLARLFGDGVEARVDYRITVPRNARIEAHSVNGHVDVDGVRGDLRLRTTNGRIEVRGAAGSVDAESTNGAIRADLVAFGPDDRVDIGTTNGSVTLTLPRNVRADVEARTSNGSIRSDFDELDRRSHDDKRLRGRLGGGGGLIALRTTNGSVRIREAG